MGGRNWGVGVWERGEDVPKQNTAVLTLRGVRNVVMCRKKSDVFVMINGSCK